MNQPTVAVHVEIYVYIHTKDTSQTLYENIVGKFISFHHGIMTIAISDKVLYSPVRRNTDRNRYLTRPVSLYQHLHGDLNALP